MDIVAHRCQQHSFFMGHGLQGIDDHVSPKVYSCYHCFLILYADRIQEVPLQCVFAYPLVLVPEVRIPNWQGLQTKLGESIGK